MSDQADSTLEILVKLGVIGKADVAAARDLLNETSVAAKEVGRSAEYLDPALANAGKSTGTAAEEAKKLGGQYRLLALGAREAGAQIPGLSILLRGLFNPTSIGLAAGILAIEAYFGHLAKVQEEQLKWTLELQKTNDALHEITSAGKSAADQFIEINKALADGQVKAHGHAHAIEQMTAEWKRYDEIVKDSTAEESQANTDSQTAWSEKIEILEKAGIITKQTAEDMKALAVYEAEVSKVKAERDTKEAEYQNTRTKRNQAQDKLAQFPGDYDLQTLAAKDQKALDRNNASIEDLPGIIAGLKQKLEEAYSPGASPEMAHSIPELYRSIESNQALLDKATKDNPELFKKVAQDQDSLEAVKKLTEQIASLNTDLRVMNQGIIDFDKTSRVRLDAAADQRNLKEFGGSAAGLMQKGEDIAQRFQKNPNSVSQAEITEMTRTAEFATGRAQTARSAMGVMLEAVKSQHVLMDDIDRLANAMEQVLYTLPNNLKNRIGAIEAFIARGDRQKQ